MSNPATVGDLEARWRPLTAEEGTVAVSLLDDAWEILLARVPYLQSRLADVAPPAVPALSLSLVIAVEVAMVLRVLRNPDGLRQESIDDYSYTRDNAVAAGLLYLSEDELGLLSPSGATTDAYTITPYGTPGYATNVPLNAWELNL